MPEPRSEWGKEIVERVEELAEKLESIARETQKVDGVMNEVRQISADRYTLMQAATRIEVQLTAIVKQFDQLAQERKEFAAFKTTGENLIWVIKWILSPPLILALFGVLVVGFDIRSTVKQHGEKIGNLEQITAKLQESAAQNTTATRLLAENVEKNTQETKQTVLEIKKELKALSALKGVAKTHDVTARFFLSREAIHQVKKNRIEFRWKLARPIEKDKVEGVKVSARLAAPSGGFEPSPAFSNTDVQLQAGLDSEGQTCWVEVFSERAEKLAETLKNSTKVPIDFLFSIPD